MSCLTKLSLFCRIISLYLILSCALYAEIASVEANSEASNNCEHWCTEVSSDSYGNRVLVRIRSQYLKPRAIYPGGQEKCIPCDCGNQSIDEREKCDDGNNVGGDGCTADCQAVEICGDRILQRDLGELCDGDIFCTSIIKPLGMPQAIFDGKKCGPDCKPVYQPYCGDKKIDLGEECDHVLPLIGKDPNVNVTDPSFKNKYKARYCNNEICKVKYLPYCGDSKIDIYPTLQCLPNQPCPPKQEDEQCDGDIFGSKPNDISDAAWGTKKCDPDSCKIIYEKKCGNGILEDGEVCDGNKFGAKPPKISDSQWGSKRCNLTSCKVEYLPYCGDGLINRPGEVCDTKKFTGVVKPQGMPVAIFNAKTCDPVKCEPIYSQYCGDGIKNSEKEICDGNDFSGYVKPTNISDEAFNLKRCNAKCSVVVCNDGVQDPSEICDGTKFTSLAKPAGMPAATFKAKTCHPLRCEPIYPPYCGDGIKNSSTEVCDGADFSGLTKPSDISDSRFNTKKCDEKKCLPVYPDICGDGEITGAELCDGTLIKSIVRPASVPVAIFNARTCTSACKLDYPPYCGDHVKDLGEQCDGGSGCTSSCRLCTGAKVYPGTICKTEAGNDYAPDCSGHNACGQCTGWVCKPRGAGCFVYGEKITLEGGKQQLVENIRKGDRILSPITGKVTIVENIVEGPEDKPIIELGVVGSTVKVSSEHIVFTQTGYKRARNLKLDDTILLANGSYAKLSILRELPLRDSERVINFILKGDTNSPEDHLMISGGIVTGDLYLQNNFDEVVK